MRTTVLAILVLTSGAAAQAEFEMGALYAAQCGRCHVLPDASLAADRAWLDQIRRTT